MSVSLELVHVTKQYKAPRTGSGRHVVLDDLSLKVEAGSFTSLLGPSGCGKSTVLHLLSGFEKPTEGKVFVAGEVIEGPSPRRPVIFQEPGLFPWLSAIENVLFGLKAQGLRGAQAKAKAKYYLSLVGLDASLHLHPHQLSGGMKQRVAIARALALEPEVLFLDEPFAALDTFARYRLQDELLRIWQERKSTVVFVTHDLDEAVYLSQRVILLSAGQGQIAGDIRVEIPRPANRTDPAFLETRHEVFSAFHLVHEASIYPETRKNHLKSIAASN